MPQPDALPPVHLPFRQMIRLLPPRRDPFTLVPDEEDDEPRHDAPECRRTHCDC